MSASCSESVEDNNLKLALKNEANEFMENGYSCFRKQDFEGAILQFSQGVSLIEQLYGPFSLALADAYFNYGRALAENGIKNTTLLGDKQPAPAESQTVPETLTVNQESKVTVESDNEDIDEDDYDDDDDQEVNLTGKFFSFGADIDIELEEDEDTVNGSVANEQAEKGAQENDDFALSWESLDTARVIYKKHFEDFIVSTSIASSSATASQSSLDSEQINKIKHSLGEVLLALGDLSLENENFPQAIVDYQEAVEIKQSCLASHDRRIAEAVYKLAVAYEYLPDRPRALEEMKRVNEILLSHISLLDPISQVSGINEVEELRKDIQLKIDELSAPQPDIVPELVKEILGSMESGFEGPQEGARDLNNLVKRKPQDDNNPSSKKPCP